MIFEREYSTGVYLLGQGTEVIGSILVSLWATGAIDQVAALSLINIALIVRLGLSALVVTHDQTEAMAMSDQILLLNYGQIEQQGTPEEMYSRPQTQFTAEFMGSNNRLPGKVAQIVDGRALLAGEGWQVWGAAREGLRVGAAATGIIRLEGTRIAAGAGNNCLRTALITSMFLGDRKENLCELGALRLRCYGAGPEAGGSEYFLELPAGALWVFPEA